ncbi:MAG: ECF transporter S component [Candidatus Riflebacteria bacterium]|nr:ECF transporter S component [Candidatus Riflebacteria bacterium]
MSLPACETPSATDSAARRICATGFFASASFLLMGLSVANPFAPYLKYEPSDVAAVMAALYLGPASGVLVVALRNLLRMTLVNPDLVGLTMNLLASGTYVWLVGTALGRRSGVRVLWPLAVATVGQMLAMFFANLLVLPLYLGVSVRHILPVLVGTVMPFNLVKGIANSILVALLHRHLFPPRPDKPTLVRLTPVEGPVASRR